MICAGIRVETGYVKGIGYIDVVPNNCTVVGTKIKCDRVGGILPIMHN